MSLYNLDEKELGQRLLKSPEVILSASSYEIDDALIRLRSEDFIQFIRKAPRDVLSYVIERVSPEGAFVLFFRLYDKSDTDKLITSLSPSVLSRLWSFLMDSVSPDILIRRLSDDALSYLLDSLSSDVLDRFVLGLSVSALRRVIHNGSVLMGVSPDVRRYIFSAYRMGDMKKWGVYLTQTLLMNIDKQSWLVLAPRLSGDDWNTLFMALDEDSILRLLKYIDRRTMRRLIRRIDKDIFMAFLMSVSERLEDILDVTLIDSILSGTHLDMSMTLHIFSTDKKKAIDILRRIPPAIVASFIDGASEHEMEILVQVLTYGDMLKSMLFALPAKASYKLWLASGEKEVYPELVSLWLMYGVDIPHILGPFVYKVIENMQPSQLVLIEPNPTLSRYILGSGIWEYLDVERVWEHVMKLPENDDLLKRIDLPWHEAPVEVFQRHMELLSKVVKDIPDGMLTLLYKDGVPDDAPLELVRRWAFLDSTPVDIAASQLMKRKCYKDVYTLMKEKGVILRNMLVPQLLKYADEDFIADVVLLGYGDMLVDTPVWKRLTPHEKAMVLLSVEDDKRKEIMDRLGDEIWEILLQIDDIDVLKEVIGDIQLSAEQFLKYVDRLPSKMLGILADHVDNIELLFENWPVGVYYSKRMQKYAHWFYHLLDDDMLIFLICSGDLPFRKEFAHLVSRMSKACIKEIPEAWRYLSPDVLKDILVDVGSKDVDLWQIVYDAGIPIPDAPVDVRYSIWQRTGDRDLFTNEEIRHLITVYPNLAQLMPVQIWREYINGIQRCDDSVLRYIPDEVLVSLDEHAIFKVIRCLPEKVDVLMNTWGRKPTLSFLARFLPYMAIDMVTEEEAPLVKDLLEDRYIVKLIEKYPDILWREICRTEGIIDVTVDISNVDDEEMLMCLRSRGVSFHGKVSIPVSPEVMKWLVVEGLIDEEMICKSLTAYGKEYILQGYVPHKRYLKCLKVKVSDASEELLKRIFDLGWWNDLDEETRIRLLKSSKDIDVDNVTITEKEAALLLKENIISPYQVAYLGYGDLLDEGVLDAKEAYELYTLKKIDVFQLYRLSPKAVQMLPPEIIDMLIERDLYLQISDETIKRLSPISVYKLLKRGVELSYDVFPSTFSQWISQHEDMLSEILYMLPERVKSDIVYIMVNSGQFESPVFWEIVKGLDGNHVVQLIGKNPKSILAHVPPDVVHLWLRLFEYRDILDVILGKIKGQTLVDALKMLNKDEIMALMYRLKPYIVKILLNVKPSDLYHSSLSVFMSLITDNILYHWMKCCPEDTFQYIGKSAFMYVVKNPCVLKVVSKEGMRRLVELAPEDVVLEIIRRTYRQCRVVSGQLVSLYGDVYHLRPSEVLVKAGLVPRK